MNCRKALLAAFILYPISTLIEAQASPAEIDLALNRAAYQSSAIDYNNVAHLATDGSSATFWQSKPEDQPWIYVDLGGLKKIDGIQLEWGTQAPKGCSIQISREERSPAQWTEVTHTSCNSSQTSNASFTPVQARFVRMLADAGSAPQGCTLNEFRVEGEAEPLPPANPADLTLPTRDQEGKISLDGPGWKLQNTLFLHDNGEIISKPSYPIDSWLAAKVPGTVLNSYLLAGAIPDPNYADQQKLVSESFFQNDFWYRKEFTAPPLLPHQHFLLNFQGINWKADIFLNGGQIGHIDGAFLRGQFDVTDKLISGQKNVLAVLIHKVANPGETNEKTMTKYSHNGGVLGYDNPTFHASIGWNWMPSIRGRDIGIWDHVYLQQTGPVMLVDPFIHSTVAADRHSANLTLQVTCKNLEATQTTASLSGNLGNISFTQKVDLAPNETKAFILNPTSISQLHVIDPQLWWPNGYGEQSLQHMKLAVSVDNQPSAFREIIFGIRELTYDTSNKILKLLCNGQPIQLNGGNWGMDETMLRYEAKDYDTAVRLHKEMHMVMIRNWVGQVGKEEFFDACDKYGLLVWNDFWLANPGDGPNPTDHAMFMSNVRDRIQRIRNHPSLALYCGRNEGDPQKDLDQGMAAETTSLDGSRYYIPHSASGLVNGHGPYEPKDVDWYFKNRGVNLHSELGIVCVPTADTMRVMMPTKDLWPIGEMWYLHDFYQPRCRIYTTRVNQLFGPSQGLDEFCEKAQMQNWENAKAMFECWRANSGSGGLAWMSHPAWPSLICQFYDYYLNPTAAFFGARIANEPLHILWDSLTNEIKVANNTGKSFAHLHAEAWIYNMDGTQKSHQECQVDSNSNGQASTCFALTLPSDLSPVYFIKLKLTDGSQVVSENFYWRGIDPQNVQALNQMTHTTLQGSYSESSENGQTILSVHLENPSDQIALMACLKVVQAGDPTKRVSPIFYSDNYVSLLPHEKRDIRVEFDPANLDGDHPKLLLDGWNVKPVEIVH